MFNTYEIVFKKVRKSYRKLKPNASFFQLTRDFVLNIWCSLYKKEPTILILSSLSVRPDVSIALLSCSLITLLSNDVKLFANIDEINPGSIEMKMLMAGSLDHCWNQILPELILFSERLEALGFRVIDDKVIIVDGNDA